MKKIILSLSSLCILFYIVFMPQDKVISNSTTPLSGHTNALGQPSCGKSACHNVATIADSTKLVIDIVGAGGSYMPTTDYIINISVVSDGHLRGGFQMMAVDSMGNSVGTFTASGLPNGTQLATVGSKTYIEHKNMSSIATISGVTTWSMLWMSPTAGTGDVTFYAIGVAANNNGNSSGDQVFSNNRTLTENLGSSIIESHSILKLYPNPSIDYITITNNQNKMNVMIMDQNAKMVTQAIIDANNDRIYIGDLPVGIYYIKAINESYIFYSQFLKQ